ncbi:MAG: histidine--tRNA ligase [Candidatus Krumholzibacteriota bacterium]|nr:histidine--tRNA ligase [Candidatus Krumholzibacteriota bacterium]
MKYKRPRGTQDLFGIQMERWRKVERLLSGSAQRYGYSEIRTPIFEMSELFIRAVGEGSDIVSKEMYLFQDKKGRNLALRPENTAPVMRAFIENALTRRGGLSRFYYLGPMFRYDRPQAGRYRQFHQFGAEAIGSSHPAVDAEIIDLSLHVFRILGFQGIEVRLNSVGCPRCRPGFTERLKDTLQHYREELCGNCEGRIEVNPLRIFDCKDCQEIKGKLPLITDYLCAECRDHFNALQDILRGMEIDFTLDPLLVRGLDYYTKTAYEIVLPGKGAQNALCGGGRYDGLAQDCGAGFIPAVGFSTGIERLVENIPPSVLEEMGGEKTDVFFIILEEGGYPVALSRARALRSLGLKAEVELSGRSMKKQLKTAVDAKADYAIFIGSDELRRSEATVKNLITNQQDKIPFSNLETYFQNKGEQDLGEIG